MQRIVCLLSILFLVSACTTAFQRSDGTYEVPRQIEVRSPFGTNSGFVKIDACRTKVEQVTWSNPLGLAEYTDCRAITMWKPTSSQGQGGQITAGALMGLGFGLGSAFSGAGNSSSSAASSTTNVSVRGHR